MPNNITIYQNSRVFWPASSSAYKIPIVISGDNEVSSKSNVQDAMQAIVDTYVQKESVLDDLNKRAGKGLIDHELLPSYVSEISSYPSYNDFPDEPESYLSDAIFLAKDTNRTYRWVGKDKKYALIGDLTDWKLKVRFLQGAAWREISSEPGKSELSLDLSNIGGDISLLSSAISTLFISANALSSETSAYLRISGDQSISNITDSLTLSALSAASIGLKLNRTSAVYTKYGLDNIEFKPTSPSSIPAYKLTFPEQSGQLGLKYNINFISTTDTYNLNDEAFNVISVGSSTFTTISMTFPTQISGKSRDFIAYIDNSIVSTALNFQVWPSCTFKSDNPDILKEIPGNSEVLFRFTEIYNNTFFVSRSTISTITS